MRRDSQKFRTYAAERVFQDTLNARGAKPFGCPQDVIGFGQAVHRWAYANVGSLGLLQGIQVQPPRFTFNWRSQSSTAYPYQYRIDVASRKIRRPLSWTPRLVLHELAHIYLGYTRRVGHGPEWAALYLKLVRQFMGKEAAALLVKCWKVQRVKYSKRRPSRRRSLTPEQRDAFVERMRIARENKCQLT